MAKGNMLLGYARGKVGDLVFSRANGTQIARARNRYPKNPRSISQAYQRMVFATISVARSRLASIVDHSFEGIPFGQKSLSEFSRLNLNRLRALSFGSADGVSDYLIKGANCLVRNEYIVSRGSLSIPHFAAQSMANNARGGVSIQNVTLSTAALTGDVAYRAELAKLGCKPGDQLTIIAISKIEGAVAEFGQARNFAANVNIARVVFKKVEEIFEYTRPLVVDGKFNPDYVTRSDGEIYVDEVSTHTALTTPVDGDEVVAGTMIRSALSADGSWRRSNSQFALVGNTAQDAPAEYVYASYMDAGMNNLGSDYYLNQAQAENPTAAVQ